MKERVRFLGVDVHAETIAVAEIRSAYFRSYLVNNNNMVIALSEPQTHSAGKILSAHRSRKRLSQRFGWSTRK